MNKRQAKKKYKAWYEQKLRDRDNEVFLDLNSWRDESRNVTFTVHYEDRVSTFGVRINNFEFPTTWTEKLYPDVIINGELFAVYERGKA